MSGTNLSVKRQWSILKERSDRPNDALFSFYKQINNLVADLKVVRNQDMSIVPGFPAGLDIDDGGAENVETNNVTYVRYNGAVVSIAADAALDTSVGVTASSTIATSGLGGLWIYADAEASTVCTCEATHPGAASAETEAAGQARWLASDHYQRNAGEIPIGLVLVTEGGSGAFTWGTDSISGETESFIDLVGTPDVVTEVSDIIVTAGASSTTWAHGTGAVVLGSGVFVALTAQTALPVNGTDAAAIADGQSGALLLYVQADGTATAMQVSSADADRDAALTSAKDELAQGNPYLACIGFILVTNNSGAAFTPGTTDFNLGGVTTEVVQLLPGNRLVASTLTTPELGD